MKRALEMLVVACALEACAAPGATTPERPALPPLDLEGDEDPVREGRSALVFADRDHDEDLRLSNEGIAPSPEDLPERPAPLYEWGDPFLGPGPLRPGVTTQHGQVLQPRFLVHGRYRSALQTFDDGDRTRSEWANRLDLFGELTLSGTERFVIGLRPLDSDHEDDFTGLRFSEGDGVSDFNGRITHAFFEGELGEIFPGLDPEERDTLDWGFAVGRAPISLQEGLLIEDSITMLGVTRNSLIGDGVSNLRVTGLFGWDDIDRLSGSEDTSAKLVGVSTAADTDDATYEVDVLYVDSDEEAFFAGAGMIRRIGEIDMTTRLVASMPSSDEDEDVGTGALLFTELSRTVHPSQDLVYWNSYWSPDEYTSAARGPDMGSEIRRVGILTDVAGMGRYGTPLGGRAIETVGTALGYQHFLDGVAEQVVFELGGRGSTAGRDETMVGVGARWQRALSANQVLRLDAFVVASEDESSSQGIRLEWSYRF